MRSDDVNMKGCRNIIPSGISPIESSLFVWLIFHKMGFLYHKLLDHLGSSSDDAEGTSADGNEQTDLVAVSISHSDKNRFQYITARKSDPFKLLQMLHANAAKSRGLDCLLPQKTEESPSDESVEMADKLTEPSVNAN